MQIKFIDATYIQTFQYELNINKLRLINSLFYFHLISNVKFEKANIETFDDSIGYR